MQNMGRTLKKMTELEMIKRIAEMQEKLDESVM